jgi:hypothetical protein
MEMVGWGGFWWLMVMGLGDDDDDGKKWKWALEKRWPVVVAGWVSLSQALAQKLSRPPGRTRTQPGAAICSGRFWRFGARPE